MKIIGTYVFTVYSDGVEQEYAFSLKGLKTPDPLAAGLIPTDIASAKLGQSPGGVTATLTGDILELKFDSPPSPPNNTVTIDALFDYHQTT